MWAASANAKATHIFSAKILAYRLYLMISFNNMLTNDIVSFEQLSYWAQKLMIQSQQR